MKMLTPLLLTLLCAAPAWAASDLVMTGDFTITEQTSQPLSEDLAALIGSTFSFTLEASELTTETTDFNGYPGRRVAAAQLSVVLSGDSLAVLDGLVGATWQGCNSDPFLRFTTFPDSPHLPPSYSVCVETPDTGFRLSLDGYTDATPGTSRYPALGDFAVASGRLSSLAVDGVRFFGSATSATVVDLPTLSTGFVEPPGEVCAMGGLGEASGLDIDRSGTLERAEFTTEALQCLRNGHDVLVTQSAATSECATGAGTLIRFGRDLDGDDVLDEDEVEASTLVCDGEDGADGTNGVDGTNGADGVNGVDGEDGLNGESGSGCSVTENADGSATISCADGTSAKVAGGSGCTAAPVPALGLALVALFGWRRRRAA